MQIICQVCIFFFKKGFWINFCPETCVCSGKFEVTKKLVNYHAAKNDKIAIFAGEKGMINMLNDNFKEDAKIGSVKIHGSTSAEEKKASLNLWQNEWDWINCSTLCTTYGTSGEGISLTAANVIILYDLPESNAKATQAIARFVFCFCRKLFDFFSFFCLVHGDLVNHEMLQFIKWFLLEHVKKKHSYEMNKREEKKNL